MTKSLGLRFSAATILALILLMGIYQGCQTSHSQAPERGHDPWVFRSVLDWQARMVTLALAPDFWVAYDAQRASFYKAWPEAVLFDGPVYTSAHGPQPESVGDAYLLSPYADPWRIRTAKGVEIPEVRYLGHAYEGERAVLKYELKLEGHALLIEERPELRINEEGTPGLERSFSYEEMPAGWEVLMQFRLNSLLHEHSYGSNGTFEGLKESQMGSNSQVDGWLKLVDNSPTVFRAWFTQEPQLIAAEVKELEMDPGLALIERSDCKTCHNEQVKTVGPAYISIAERYKSTPANLASLSQKVMNGGAGVWGQQVMTAHPDLQLDDAKKMVSYILSLDGEGPIEEEAPTGVEGFMEMEVEYEHPGLVANVFTFEESLLDFPEIADKDPVASIVAPFIHIVKDEDFGGLQDNFYIEIEGFIHIPQSSNYVFRLLSDDGSQLYIDGELIVDHGGLHGFDPMDGEVLLEEGVFPIKVRYFEAGGGQALSLQWVAHGEDGFSVIPPTAFSHDPSTLKETSGLAPGESLAKYIPGDTKPLEEVHPSFDLEQMRPSHFQPKVGGLDVMDNGNLVVSTWDPDGAVYLLSNVDNGNPENIRVKKIAAGLAEPLGLKVVEDTIYVLQKQELTQLIDHTGDGIIDEYRTLCNGWRASSNFHEFAFGLVYEDGYFYATLATAIEPGGASTQPQIPDRGRAFKISRKDGSFEFIAQGLRTPNGIGIGVDGEKFIADNQGDWLPASKIIHLQEGAFYGSRSVDVEGTASLTETKPVVWLPQDEIGNSPSQPASLDVGPYAGQMIHGEVTHGGVKRVFVEKVDGAYQGCVFRFTQGLEAGVNRLVWGPDGKLYIGGVGSTGNWGHYGKLSHGLQRLAYNGRSTFEMLAVRAKSNGMEIEFTEPLPVNEGFDPADYDIRQWFYLPTENYGGPKLDDQQLEILSINISEDRHKVFLELADMKPNHLIYVHLKKPFVSERGHSLWTTEAWYTLNRIPSETGFVSTYRPEQVGQNELSQAEKKEGWKLLFDGQSTNGWRSFGTKTIGSAWKVEDGLLTLNGEQEGWQFKDGGDIVTTETFDNYELRLEWKISENGNSGLMYHVQDDGSYEYPWHTGPEMQILHDEGHPDGRIFMHRAGDLYDLIPSTYRATNPPGVWNEVRLVSNQGKIEHWLNGHKVVSYDMNSAEWQELVANSKFGEMQSFGQFQSGHISLQDHGNEVWFRNIKIKSLTQPELAAK
ncbi:MAG: family 16 glycoside hydrolase [Bacteroidota bacterium]